jgi:hypothetical protein
VEHALANQVVEARLEEEDRVIATVSGSTLEYMYRHGLARERRLRRHRGDLGFEASFEYDLVEAMRLAARLSTTERSITRASRLNERLRSEMVRREADLRPRSEEAAWRLPFVLVDRGGAERHGHGATSSWEEAESGLASD